MEVDNKREDTSEDDRNAERIYAHSTHEDSDGQNFDNDPAETELSQEILLETIHSLVNRSAKRRKKRRIAKPVVKKKRKIDIHQDDDSADGYVRATSRCSIPYLFEVIKFIKTKPHFVKLVTDLGFADILELDECYVPRAYVQWIADHTLPEQGVIRIGDREIKLSPGYVVQSVGIPNGSLPVEGDDEDGKSSFLSAFGLTDIPSIRYFGNKILFEKNISDVDFCRCFMVVCNGTFLCPNSSTKPSTQYLGALVDVDKIKDRNWAKFVHDWLLLFIDKYLVKMKKKSSSYLTLGGCIYHLAVRCLDFTCFGAIKLPNTLPRIHVWKGAMIKHFSDMTIGKDCKYGACLILPECETCYAQRDTSANNLTSPSAVHVTGSVTGDPIVLETETTAPADLNVLQILHEQLGSNINIQRKRKISDSIDRGLKDVEPSIKLKAVSVVIEVVKLVISNCRESEETLKLPSSEENENSIQYPKSQENINDGELQGSANQRCSQHSIKSQHSEVHKDVDKDKQEVDQCVKELSETLVQNIPLISTDKIGPAIVQGFKDTPSEPQGYASATSASLVHFMETKYNIASKQEIEQSQEFKFNSTPDLNDSLAEDSNSMDKKELMKHNEFSGFQSKLSDTKHGEHVSTDFSVSQKADIESMKKDTVEECYSNGLLPEIMVNVITDIGSAVGVVKEVRQDGTCSVLIETELSCNELIVLQSKVQIIEPKKNDSVKVLCGSMSGYKGKLIGLAGDEEAIVRFEDTGEIKVLDLINLGIFKMPLVKQIHRRMEDEQQNNKDDVIEKIPAHIKTYSDWCSYIDEARKKYHFNDDSVPSFRLLPYHDDFGNYIDEMVLWRPIGMDSKTYETKNLAAKHNYKICMTPPSKQSIRIQEIEHHNLFPDSIQCAQKQAEVYDLTTDSPEQNHKFIKEATNSIVNITCSSSTCRTPSSTRYFKNELVGKKLFYEDENCNSSQEVKFMGTKLFSESCMDMSKKTDEMYNTKLTLGSSSSFSGKENVAPKRVLQPSRYVCSPYGNVPKKPITPNEYKMYDVITTLCDDEEYSLKWAINIDNCKVSLKQLGRSFKQDGWVEAFTINTFCRKLFRDCHPNQSGKHYFFNTVSDYFLEKWKTEDARIEWQEKTIDFFQKASTAKPLHLSKRIYFPTIFSLHWFLFAVDLKSRCFLFLDSIYGKYDNYQIMASELLIKNFKLTWRESGQKAINFDSFEKVYPVVPKQPEGNNCGIHCMKLMESYCPRNPSLYAYSDKDVPYFRVRYAIDNLFTTHNKENFVKNLALNFDIKTYKQKLQAIRELQERDEDE